MLGPAVNLRYEGACAPLDVCILEDFPRTGDIHDVGVGSDHECDPHGTAGRRRQWAFQLLMVDKAGGFFHRRI